MPSVHEAARRNDVEELRRLLDEDPGLVEVAAEGVLLMRPLHVACVAGSMEAACLLLDRGAATDAICCSRGTPLMMACEAGRVGVVSMLLQRGVDPSPTASVASTALISASDGEEREGSDHLAVIRLLLRDGRVPVEARDEVGRTALWWACARGFTERARVLLLEGRADHTLADYEDRTCMRAARHAWSGDCVRLLKWHEAELERALMLSKARAVVDATESIRKAPEKVGAKTEEEAQRAKGAAAPAWLRGRVERGEALPSVEVVVREAGESEGGKEQREEEERCAVLTFAVTMLKDDLHMELMEGLRLR